MSIRESTCLFCKIIEGEVPSKKIFENDSVIAFLDIHPVNPGHTLVVPKKHFVNIYELPPEETNAIFDAVRILSTPIKKGMGATGINIEMNNDPDAGQIVNHAHVHIVPRFHDDGFRHWPGKDATSDELTEIGNKIREFL